MWVEEDTGKDSNNLNLPTPAFQSYADQRVTIKSRMRKITVVQLSAHASERSATSCGNRYLTVNQAAKKHASIAKFNKISNSEVDLRCNQRNKDQNSLVPRSQRTWSTQSEPAVEIP